MSDAHTVSARTDVVFRHDYRADQAELRKLYENAKRDQWNASRDVPWERAVDLDEGAVADELVDVWGTPYWDRLSKRERARLNHRLTSWRLSTLLYGEHGAMLICSQLVESVPGSDAKLFQATQVMDEARHAEVLSRYIEEKLEGLRYPMPKQVREIFDEILADSRWTVKTIGLQLVAETFAVSLFRMMAETSKDPLLREVCRRILADESRHMGFGMLSLPAVVAEMSERERREHEEVTEWALRKTMTGGFAREVYEDTGYSAAEIDDIRRIRRERASGGEAVLFRQVFKKELDATLLANLERVGLLSAAGRERLRGLGVGSLGA